MVNSRSRPWASLLAAAAVTFGASISQAAAPGAPPSFCVNGVCRTSQASTTTSSATGSAMKWHPGVYVTYVGAAVNYVPGARWDLQAQRDQVLAFIGTICSEPAIKGVSLIAMWRTLEGDTAGDYSAGFAAVDAVLAKLSSCGKYLQLGIQAQVFGFVSNASWVLPAYVVGGANWDSSSGWHGSTGSYGVTNLGFTVLPYAGFTARVWQQATADRFIALAAAYGARYNSNRNFEMLSIYGETALQLASDGYSSSALATQIKRVYTAARPYWPNTGLKLFVNDLGNDASWLDLFAAMKASYVALSNPDTWPADITASDRMFVGKDANGNNAYEDLRDKLPWVANVDWQSFNLDGDHPRFSLQQLWDVHLVGYTPSNPNGNGSFPMPSLKARYGVWYVNQSNGNSENQWSTAELPFLKAHAAAYNNAACPSLYPSCSTQ